MAPLCTPPTLLRKRMEHPTGMSVVPLLTPPVLQSKTNGGVIPPTGISCPFSDIPPSSFFFAFIHVYTRGLLRRRDKKCRGAELNRRRQDFQSCALPTELPRHLYCLKLLEINFIRKISCVNGKQSHGHTHDTYKCPASFALFRFLNYLNINLLS